MKHIAQAMEQTSQLVDPENKCTSSENMHPLLSSDNPIMQRIFRRMEDTTMNGGATHDRHSSHESHNTFSQGWLDPPRTSR